MNKRHAADASIGICTASEQPRSGIAIMMGGGVAATFRCLP